MGGLRVGRRCGRGCGMGCGGGVAGEGRDEEPEKRFMGGISTYLTFGTKTSPRMTVGVINLPAPTITRYT